MGANLRREVLSMYKRILKVGKTWQVDSLDPSLQALHRDYIVSEAKQHFRQNRNMLDIQQIQHCLHEAESRLALALHYKTPYPRPVNVPPMTYATATEGKRGTTQRRRMLKETTTQINLKSLQDDK